jgi:hypothetical protein
MPAILPKLEDIKITFAVGERSGNKVWKRWIGRRVLASKCSCISAIVVDRMGRKEDPVPAVRIRLSIFLILFSAITAKREAVAVAREESESVKGTMRSLLPCPTARPLRPSVEVSAERIVATTVVLGRRRSERVRPKPMPILLLIS